MRLRGPQIRSRRSGDETIPSAGRELNTGHPESIQKMFESFSETSVTQPTATSYKHERTKARSKLTSNHRVSLKSIKRKVVHAKFSLKIGKALVLKAEKETRKY
jgi:hypothetical protein